MALPHEKVRNYIPNDLVFSIMLKLPLKSLSRFKCVHKFWAISFENPNFMKMYYQNSISNNSYHDTHILLKQTRLDFEKRSALYLLSGDKKVKLHWPPPFQGNNRNINILGSGVNGFLCLYAEGINTKCVVWNPSVGRYKIVLPSLASSLPRYVWVVDQLYGFGYDSLHDDYKLIRYVKYHIDPILISDPRIKVSDVIYDPIWEIYSLNSDSWRKLNLEETNSYKTVGGDVKQMYLHGMCHWLGECEEDNYNEYLVSFDLGWEKFFLTSLPSSTMDDGRKLVRNHLTRLNESIALISIDKLMTTFHISILCEIGVKESWIKLFTVGPLDFLGYPIGAGKNDNLFFINKNGVLAKCDLCTNTIQEIGIKRICTCCQVVIYEK